LREDDGQGKVVPPSAEAFNVLSQLLAHGLGSQRTYPDGSTLLPIVTPWAKLGKKRNRLAPSVVLW